MAGTGWKKHKQRLFGRKGGNSSEKEVGQWYETLIKGRSYLPAAKLSNTTFLSETMAELAPEEIEEKRSKLNIQAERHRNKRDKLNMEAKRWADIRDKLNGEVRELVERANVHKESRDKLNNEVREIKKKRDEWNNIVSEKMGEVNKLKKKFLPKDGNSMSKLKKQLKALEFQQMTSVMEPKKERELMELLAAIQQQIKIREDILKKNDEVRNAMEEEKKAKEEAEKYHALVGELAEKAQVEHDNMLELFFERDKLRKEADRGQERFVNAKEEADKEHKEHVDIIRQVHDYDKILTGVRQKLGRHIPEGAATDVKRTADGIYEKFKKGEKLSTEDLMSLQKAGYL